MENASLLTLFVRSVFVDNMIFALFLGMCSYLAVSKSVKTALGLGIAVTLIENFKTSLFDFSLSRLS